jgi:osmotically-inducible protein OsmY
VKPLTCLGVLLLVFAAGCSPRDGDVLRKIVRKMGDRLEDTTRPVSQLAGTARAPAVRTDLAARVQARLRWDRYLDGARFEVRDQGKGVVVLSGQVAEDSVKQRALELAKSTAGVESVTDEVKVAEADDE